jgi:hypothetical protein
MSRPDTRRLRAPIAALVALGALVGGCSDLYYDRREAIAPGAGDAIAANQMTQMLDPWPRNSGNRNIPFNGERMQAAVERYRHNKVIPPVNATTSSAAYQRAQQAAASTTQATQSATAAPAPAAPVK